MGVLSRLFISAALSLVASQSFALTGEEVWAQQTDLLSGSGVTISQTQSRQGNVLTVADISFDVALPFGLGSISVRTGPQTYTENADGTVSIGYGQTNTVAIAASFRPDDGTEINLAANLQVVLKGNSAVASGTASDMTFVRSADLIELTLTDVTISGAPDVQDLAIEGYVSVADTDATVQVTTGASTQVHSRSRTGLTIVDYSFAMGEDLLTKTVSRQSGIEATSVFTVPASPMDLLNISQALRDGLALDVTYESGASQSQTVTFNHGEMISDQSTNVTAADTSVRFDAGGLALSGSASGFEVLVPVMAGLPFPLSVTGAAVDYSFAFPVNASDQPGELHYAVSMSDLVVNDELWAMFDPTAALPRDPMSFKIDLAGTVKLLVDLLDIDSMTQTIDAGGLPFDPQSVTINELSASGAGASATAAGEFALDMSDLITFAGFPRPTGQATATLSGVNGLLDKLISVGLLAPDDAMQGRLMMGMFARVVGEDQLRSTLEITPEGHVIANGQRIQ